MELIKFPFYSIVNMLFVGFNFIGCIGVLKISEVKKIVESDVFNKITLLPETIVLIFILTITYQVGLVLNRMGSVILEPILQKFEFISYDKNKYHDFQEKKKEYPIMSVLSREYAVSRTGSIEFIILSLISLLDKNCFGLVVYGMISIVFLFSTKKFSKRISDIINKE